MSVTVSVDRETELYGKEVWEKWSLTFDPEAGAWEYDVRVIPNDSDMEEIEVDTVPPRGVPSEVLDARDEQIQSTMETGGMG
jgi:hypothetical protein